jgi:hypothetical protein
MNIPDEVIEQETGVAMEDWEYPQQVRDIFKLGAEWARKDALREAAAVAESEGRMWSGSPSHALFHAADSIRSLPGGDKA